MPPLLDHNYRNLPPPPLSSRAIHRIPSSRYEFSLRLLLLLTGTIIAIILPVVSAQIDYTHDHGVSSAVKDTTLYDANFLLGADQTVTRRQAVNGVTAIVNNTPVEQNILPGQTLQYFFSKTIVAGSNSSTTTATNQRRQIEELKALGGNSTTPQDQRQHDEQSQDDHYDAEEGLVQLEKRQSPDQNSTRTVYITINTCLQPVFKNANDNANPPQLTLHVTTTNPNGKNGVTNNNKTIAGPGVTSVALQEGYAIITLNTTDDVYIGVSANDVEVASAAWNYEIAASVDEPYHSVFLDGPKVYMIDSDKSAALLITRNLSALTPNTTDTTNWLASGPPLSIFVQNVNDTSIAGLTQSYCGLKQRAQIVGNNLAPVSGGIELTLSHSQGFGQEVEQQFYVPNLNASSRYYGILALTGNSTAQGSLVAGGGGTILGLMNFTTKKLANCQVIYDLSFCTTVAYAVPANPATFTSPAKLAALYDNSTQQNYQYFDWALQQTACNTTDTAQYSLVKGCDDCAAAYKTWLCAVSIPRCEDWPTDPGTFPPPVPGGYIVQPTQDYAKIGKEDGGIEQGEYALPPAPFPPPTVYLMPRNAAQQPIAATPEIAPVTDPRLLEHLATNSSRNNGTIAQQIMPGPYMEVLPCQDLCFDIVRSCPATLAFGCPRLGKGLEVSYGRPGLAAGGGVMCSEPGVLWGFSAGSRVVPRAANVMLVVAVVVAWLVKY